MDAVRSSAALWSPDGVSRETPANQTASARPLTAARYFRHLVLDDFLGPELHQRLLTYTLIHEAQFLPTKIGNSAYSEGLVDPDFRKSWYCHDGLGELTEAFRLTVEGRSSEIVQRLGIAPFSVARIELELAAHRHGSFFRRHIDTATQSARDRRTSDRVITAVYYFHSVRKQFSGGELALAPLGPGDPMLIEPRNNRLVAFASVVPHEVLPVVCPDDAFANARFAVNVWLHRAKPGN